MYRIPDVTIYANREPAGEVVPYVALIEGIAFPILDAQIGFDPNGRSGTRAMTLSLRMQADARIEHVEFEAIEEIAAWSLEDVREALIDYAVKRARDRNREPTAV